jgi:xanthine/uracil permease
MSLNHAAAQTRSGRHPVDEVLPAHKLLAFGVQHLFIMYAGAVPHGGAPERLREKVAD